MKRNKLPINTDWKSLHWLSERLVWSGIKGDQLRVPSNSSISWCCSMFEGFQGGGALLVPPWCPQRLSLGQLYAWSFSQINLGCVGENKNILFSLLIQFLLRARHKNVFLHISVWFLIRIYEQTKQNIFVFSNTTQIYFRWIQTK